MENKIFHQKNYFLISSNKNNKNHKNSISISIDKTNHTSLKRFKQFIVKNNQKNKQKIIKQKEKSNIYRTPNKKESKKDSINDYSTINIKNNSIYYSQKLNDSSIRNINSENRKNPYNISYIKNDITFTPNKHLSTNIIKHNKLEKTIVPIFSPNKRLSTDIIKSNRFQKITPHPITHQRYITISNLKKSNMNARYSNILKKQNEIKNLKKEIKINLLKKMKFQPKITFMINENEKNESQKDNNDTIIKFGKILYNLKTLNAIESKNERINNFIQGISYTKKKCELCHKLVDKHLYKFHYYSHPSQILNWMFLGNFKNANNLDEIRKFKIKYILNCAIEVEVKNIPKDIKYYHISLTDSNTTDITQYFEQAFNLIELARKKRERILIHCKLGISRSASIIIGYLIKYMGYTTSSALAFLRTKRPRVNPNPGFISQLNSYEKSIKKRQRKSNISNYSTQDFSI